MHIKHCKSMAVSLNFHISKIFITPYLFYSNLRGNIPNSLPVRRSKSSTGAGPIAQTVCEPEGIWVLKYVHK